MIRPDEERQIPTFMPTTNRPINAGTAMDNDTSRLDAVAKATGRARFGRDMYLPNGLFVRFIRCPWGLADLEAADTEAALRVPGVIEVVLDENNKRGQYDGHNIGHLVATSPTAVSRGMRALACRWSRHAPKTRIEDSMEDAPEVKEDIARHFDAADHVLEAVYTTQVQTHCALETHGAVVDHRGDSATVYSSTQGTFAARDGLDEALGL